MKGFTIAAVLVLTACSQQQLQQAQAVGTAVAPIIAPVVQQAAKTVPVLSEIALVACAAQAAANTAGAVATAQGNAAWAANFSQASQIAGVGCAW